MNKKYLDGIDVIYWINLDRATDRKKNMEKIFQDPLFEGIKIVRISALDAKHENPRIKFKLEENSDLNNTNRYRTDTEYAILYSHLEAIREFSKTNYKNAIIFEDDLSLNYKKYWKKTVQEVMDNAPKDWEILKLCSFPGKVYTHLYTLWDAFKIQLPVHNKPPNYKWMKYQVTSDFNACGYLIHNKAAKSIIHNLYDTKYKLPNEYPHASDILIFKCLKTYIYKYPFFTYNNKLTSYNTKKRYYLDVYKHKFTTAMYKKTSKTRKNKL